MESAGVPGMLLPLVIAVELLGGLAVIFGWHTRVAAFLLAGFSLLSAVLFHANVGDQMQMIMFMKNLALAGGFLMIVALGAGAYSLDNRRSAEMKPDQLKPGAGSRRDDTRRAGDRRRRRER